MHETEKDIQHRQLAEQKLSSEGRKYFKFIEFDADEELVTEIRKHPVGLALVLISGGIVMLMVFLAAIYGAIFDFEQTLGIQGANAANGILMAVSLVVIVGVAVMTYIAAFLYRSNVIFVTSEKIAQVVYRSLFDRKISQLSIGDVQDVTVSQKGILAHAFNYGTLVIETAGEQENYSFNFVPEPYQVSKLIVGAHERNLKEYGN